MTSSPTSLTTHLVNILTLGRIKFLVYSPLYYTLGAAVATMNRSDKFCPSNYFLGLFINWFVHAMTHYANEYYDYDTDCQNTECSPWTGGSRILVEQKLSPKFSLNCAYVTTVVALGMIALLPNYWIMLLALISVVLCWGYSAPPLKLSRRGCGELTVVLVLNTIYPIIGFVLQDEQLESMNEFKILLYTIVPLSMIQFVRMMVMNIPDIVPDSKVGKNTLVVKIGTKAASLVYPLVVIFSYFTGVAFLLNQIIPLIPNLMLLVSSPLGLLVSNWVYKYWNNPVMFGSVPFWATLHTTLAAWLVLLGYMLASDSNGAGYWIKFMPVVTYVPSVLYFKYVHPKVSNKFV